MEALKYNILDSLEGGLKDVVSDNSIITITDSLGRIKYANKEFCEILECEANSLIGETHKLFKSHLHTDKKYKDLWSTIRMNNKWHGVLSGKSTSGNQFWLDTTIIPVTNKQENTTTHIAIYKDITESHIQTTQLTERNIEYSRYKSIYQSNNVGVVVVTDSQGIIIEWNKAAELAFGYLKKEILGYPLSVLISNRFKKRNIKELLRAIDKIKYKNKTGTIEMYCVRKNEKEFPVEFTLNTINTENNNIYCATIIDITKRKKLEDKLKQQTNALQIYLNRIKHDIVAPFASAEGLLDLLKDEEVSERVNALSDMLFKTIQGGKALVNNLNHEPIISNSTNALQIIDFNIIINQVLELLSGSKNFELFKIKKDINNYHHYSSNPEWIMSIFQNLIQNALKYSKELSNGYTPKIDISVKSLQKEVIIKVIDNGVGISENCIDNVFNLNYRASKDDAPGDGLGLYIVKNIVENLEGTISVKSEINKGASFEIVLPNLN